MNLTKMSNAELLDTFGRKIASMTNAELQDKIDEYIAIIEMGLLKGAELAVTKKTASLLAYTLLRRQGKISS